MMDIHIISLGKNGDDHHDEKNLIGGPPHGSQVVNNHV